MTEEQLREHTRAVIKGTAEPKLHEMNYSILLIEYMNYHNSISSDKEKRKWVLDFLKKINLVKYVPIIDKATDYELRQLGPLCHAKSRGFFLSEKHVKIIEDIFSSLIKKYSVEIKTVSSQVKVSKVRSQEERDSLLATEYLGQIDEQIDSFFETRQTKFSMQSFVQDNSISSSVLAKMQPFIVKKMIEITSAVSGKDKDLVEGYSHLNKAELKRYLAMLIGIVQGCTIVVQPPAPIVKTRKPRAVKVKTKSDLLKYFKYLKSDPVLKLKSIDPQLIFGSKELWVYDTDRFLMHFVAENGKTLSVDRMTITGFDKTQSVGKMIRKPHEFFPSLVMAKASFSKAFSSISTTAKSLNGRINSRSLILKVF